MDTASSAPATLLSRSLSSYCTTLANVVFNLSYCFPNSFWSLWTSPEVHKWKTTDGWCCIFLWAPCILFSSAFIILCNTVTLFFPPSSPTLGVLPHLALTKRGELEITVNQYDTSKCLMLAFLRVWNFRSYVYIFKTHIHTCLEERQKDSCLQKVPQRIF